MPSLLINEDGRGRGQVLSMDLPEFNIDDDEVVLKIEKQLSVYKTEKFSSFKLIGSLIDKKFEVMKDFLKGLNE